MATPEHLDDAERAEAWSQALALWQRAIATCPVEQPAYAEGVARCQRQIDVDVPLTDLVSQHRCHRIRVATGEPLEVNH